MAREMPSMASNQVKINADRLFETIDRWAQIGPGVDYEIESEWSFGTEVFDQTCIDLVCRIARERGIEPLMMHNQAGHDACNMCAIAPTALIFCACIDGITHNENVDAERAPKVQAANVLQYSVLPAKTVKHSRSRVESQGLWSLARVCRNRPNNSVDNRAGRQLVFHI
jgi:hypothetical protein